MTKKDKIYLAIVTLTASGFISTTTQAALMLTLTGTPGLNVINYTAGGSITVPNAVPADWTDPVDIGSGVARAPVADEWDSGFDNNLGDVFVPFDDSTNDDLSLSIPIPVFVNGTQLDSTNGSGVRITESAAYDTIDLDPSDTSPLTGDDVELDNSTEIVYDALGAGDIVSWGAVSGTFTLDNGNFEDVLNPGIHASDSSIFEVTIIAVPEPLSRLLFVLCAAAIARLRRN